MTDVKPKTLSKVSDYGRGLLAALGESVDDHQREVKARLSGERPAKQKADPILAKLQAGTAKIGPTIEEAAIALAKRQAMWKEDAYCIFIAHVTCKGCGAKNTLQQDPQIYLRMRCTKKDQLNSFIYTPIKSYSNISLPKVKIATFVTPFACEACFENTSWLPSSKYSLDDIESPEDLPETLGNTSSSFPLTQQPASISGEDIAMSNLSTARSLIPLGDPTHMNFVTSHLLAQENESLRALAGSTSSPIGEGSLARPDLRMPMMDLAGMMKEQPTK